MVENVTISKRDRRQIVVKCPLNVTLFQSVDKYAWSMLQTCVIKFSYRSEEKGEKSYITTTNYISNNYPHVSRYEFLFISFVKISISMGKNISTTRSLHCVIDNHAMILLRVTMFIINDSIYREILLSAFLD